MKSTCIGGVNTSRAESVGVVTQYGGNGISI